MLSGGGGVHEENDNFRICEICLWFTLPVIFIIAYILNGSMVRCMLLSLFAWKNVKFKHSNAVGVRS